VRKSHFGQKGQATFEFALAFRALDARLLRGEI
jgi:hypothetical protein